ncbi:MAG: hypothetical protein KBI30_02015 [Candidatus Atribacteria bacterium]|nr:hypothetical protein [Candidatus Atribacteria bacterium]
MKIFWILVSLWFLGGIVTNILLRKEKLEPIYRVLLFFEGLLGLMFYLLFKGALPKDGRN